MSGIFSSRRVWINKLLCHAARTFQMKLHRITDVSVFHGSDVRPEATVSWGQHGFHARLQLVERHRKCCEVVHLKDDVE